MYKILFILILLLVLLVFLFLNLGKFLDITQEAKKADIIVALGGASGCRLKTALSLYKKGFSTSGKIIYTGKEYIGSGYSELNSRKDYLLKNDVCSKDIVHIDRRMITNTMEEVLFIKKYMLKHNYKSVIFVSHPHHSRRIATLAQLIANYTDAGLSIQVVSCNPSWWNRERFFLNETSIKISISEAVKLIYNLLKYSPFFIEHTKYFSRIENGEWDRVIKQLH